MGKKILVAEDDKFIANAYRVRLEKEGFDVTIVADGDSVLKELEKGIPDLLLVDLIMPTKDGFAVLEEVQKNPKYSSIPIVVASNLDQDDDVKRAVSLGALEYVVKSEVSLNDLVQKIYKVMEVSNARQN